MFARTERLLLRPGWAEDAPALARAIGDEMIVRNLAVVPWPYSLRDAEAFLASFGSIRTDGADTGGSGYPFGRRTTAGFRGRPRCK